MQSNTQPLFTVQHLIQGEWHAGEPQPIEQAREARQALCNLYGKNNVRLVLSNPKQAQ